MKDGGILFLDQSGQLGGAELCLADLAAGWGGPARVLLLSNGPLVPHLRRRGVKVFVLPAAEKLNRIEKGSGFSSALRLLPEIPPLLSSLRYVVGNAESLYLNTAKALLLGTVANLGKPMRRIFHLHDLLTREHFSTMNLRLILAAVSRMDLVIANSQATADALAGWGVRKRIEVIPNGFDPAPFDQVKADEIIELRRRWNPRNLPVVAVFGRLARWKGQDVILRALAAERGICLWIVGEALFTGDDRAYAEELRAMARGNDSVHILGFQPDVPALMRAADLIVHTSTAAEPFGRVIVEAMLSGKPVIASDAGGPREIVQPGVTGLLIEPGNPEALRRAILELLSSPATMISMGQAGRALAMDRYSLPVVIEKTRQAVSSAAVA